MDFVKTRNKDGLVWVTLDRPDKMNALNAQVLEELDATFKALMTDDSVRVIAIKGSGEKAFAAGADVNQFPSLTPDEALEFSRKGQAVFSNIEASLKPVIAAVNGFALGGGCELALACHLRVASENAVFGQPEVKLGVIAGYGGTQRLPRLIGSGRALDLLLTGRTIKAEEALSIGLVNGVCPQSDLVQTVEALAYKLMEQGLLAQGYTLKAVYGGADHPLEDGLEAESQAFRAVFDTEDRIEGAKAFLERRPPNFKNR